MFLEHVLNFVANGVIQKVRPLDVSQFQSAGAFRLGRTDGVANRSLKLQFYCVLHYYFRSIEEETGDLPDFHTGLGLLVRFYFAIVRSGL
jgi:hypothetical protein